MSGKLPIDRARARTIPARPYEEHKQSFTEDQARRDRRADTPVAPPAAQGDERDEERNDA